MAATSSRDAVIHIEISQEVQPLEALTYAGDLRTFTFTAPEVSGKSSVAPDIRPNGLINGAKIVPAASGTADLVDIFAFSAYSKGVKYVVATAEDQTITRGATSEIAKVSSITMTSAGAIAILPGMDSTDTTVNRTRGVAGGPPFIPEDDVSLGEVQFSGAGAGTSVPIGISQVFQTPGQHVERSNLPSFELLSLGKGAQAEAVEETYAHIRMAGPLPLVHTGSEPKRIWATYATPGYYKADRASEFSPSQTTFSGSSASFYRGQLSSSVSSSLGEAGFKGVMEDGISDLVLEQEGQVIIIKFYQDENKAPYSLTQGVMGITTAFPVEGFVSGDFKIITSKPTVRFLE